MSPIPHLKTTLATGLVLCTLVSTQASALEGSWQAGINAGISQLSPDTDGSGFTLDGDQSTAVSVYLGYDITPIISAEIAFSDLGEAELSQDQTIGYQAISIGATAYIFGAAPAADRSEGLSVYARLGFSTIENESDIDLNESNNTAVWLGAGVQYPLSRSWGLRAELTSFDGDAQALLAGIYWRSAGDRAGGSFSGAVAAPVSRADNPQAATRPAQPGSVEPAVRTPASQPDQSCPAQAVVVIPDKATCSLLNSTVAGLQFDANTATLTTQGARALNRVVAALKANPRVVIEVQAHTQALGNAQSEAQLSAQRAKAVARYLVQNGVPVSQLRAKAFGATQPIASGNTAAGQQQNNRIVLRSL